MAGLDYDKLILSALAFQDLTVRGILEYIDAEHPGEIPGVAGISGWLPAEQALSRLQGRGLVRRTAVCTGYCLAPTYSTGWQRQNAMDRLAQEA